MENYNHRGWFLVLALLKLLMPTKKLLISIKDMSSIQQSSSAGYVLAKLNCMRQHYGSTGHPICTVRVSWIPPIAKLMRIKQPWQKQTKKQINNIININSNSNKINTNNQIVSNCLSPQSHMCQSNINKQDRCVLMIVKEQPWKPETHFQIYKKTNYTIGSRTCVF